MVRQFSRSSEFFDPLFRSRGTVLLEVLVSSLITVVVILAVGTFFLENLRVFNRGKEQMELQRMGTLAMEGMVRAIREGSQVSLGNYDGISNAYQAIQISYPGEPFFDVNHNGVWDSGEPFVDIDRNGQWNGASDGTGGNPMPTVYFEFDPGTGTIKRGTDPFDCVDWDILVNDGTRGSIWFDAVEFDLAIRSVGMTFTIRNDMATSDPADDISMDFSSSVKFRE